MIKAWTSFSKSWLETKHLIQCSVRGLDGSPTALAHQLPRVAGSTPGLEPSQETLARRACTGPYGQHCDRCVHQPTRWSTLPSHVTTRPPPPPLESEASEVASRHSHPGLAQSDSRWAVTSCAPRRMETPSPNGPADLATFWTRTGRPVRVPRDVALPVVLLPDRRNTRHGRTGTQLAAGPSQICISPGEPSRTDSVQGQRGRGAGPARGTIMAYQDLVPRADAPRDSPSLADSSEEGSTDSETGHLMAPASRPLETSCLVPRRDAEVLGDLAQEVVDTITSARAPSTRHAYALKWNLFVKWCSSHREDPRRCPIRVVLSFLQQGLERRLSPSTLKVYVAAIAANHDPVEGKSVGKHDWVVRFLRGARRLTEKTPGDARSESCYPSCSKGWSEGCLPPPSRSTWPRLLPTTTLWKGSRWGSMTGSSGSLGGLEGWILHAPPPPPPLYTLLGPVLSA